MYEILVDGKTIYYPSNRDYSVFDTDLGQDIGLAGEFKFSVPDNNPLYGTVGQGSIVTVLRDNDEYWRGEVKEIEVDHNNTKKVYCLEDLSWLADESPVPTSITNETYIQRFQAMITLYNSGRPTDRQFRVGYLTNVTQSAKPKWNTEYGWSILDCLRNLICRDTGYIRVRRVKSGSNVLRYIDIVRLDEYGVQATQPITFGVNLLEYLKKMDMGNFTNAITPYGAELEDEQLYTDYSKRIVGTSIQDAASISRYGRHAKGVIFEGVTNLTQLNGLAQAYLTRYSQPQISMELKAIDLAEISIDTHYEIGDSIHVVAEPYDIDQWVYLTKRNMNLQDVGQNSITLSSHVVRGSTLTQQSIQTAEMVNDVPSKSSILEAAKRNALNMLLDETQGGYVCYEYHKNSDGNADYIEAINICDAPTIAASKSRWRWSYNGLGFMSRSSAGTGSDPEHNPAWSSLSFAITNDGKINANRILTGTLNADTVEVKGKIKATSGYIGNETNGWQIGNNNIYNGVTSMSDNSHAGTYVGVDGIRFNQKPTDPSPLAYTKITKLGIDCQTVVTATGGITGGNISSGRGKEINAYNSSGNSAVRIKGSDGSITAQGNIVTTDGNITTNDGDVGTIDGRIIGNGYYGKSDEIWTIKDGDGNWHALNIKGGVIVSTS